MHRQSAHGWATGLLLALLAGCGLPKVALGASVSLGRAAGQDSAARARIRSAVWLGLVYTPGAGQGDAEHGTDPPELDEAFERTGAGAATELPCAFEAACALERESIEQEREGELAP